MASLTDGFPPWLTSPAAAFREICRAFFPSSVRAKVDLGSWPVPPIFSYLASLGKLDREELLATFNMGVGMILIVPQKHLRALETDLKRRREKFYRIGEIVVGNGARITYSGQLAL